MGYPDGIYRDGPLARVNIADRMGTPRADEELEKFRWRVGRVAGSSFHYHYARLIDTLHCIEKIEEILRGPDILSTHVKSRAEVNRLEGIGVSEAPRGTLMHHYKVDENGIVQWANLVIATGHNNMAMNRAVLQVARQHVKGDHLEEPMLNRVEAVIRCYDPCLSCSTHALGEMALRIQLLGPDGTVLSDLAR
jgi:NAD-reducing hydrogenase large subunit